MGALYFDEGSLPDVLVSLTPYNMPITIPASGGTFEFNIELENISLVQATFDTWTDVTMPSGSPYGPIINVPDVTLGVGASVNRDRTQNVPSSAPSGSYSYNAYVGYYPNIVIDEDNFTFVKECDADGSALVSNWYNWGEEFGDLCEGCDILPAGYTTISAYPNPFNPVTNLNINLVEAGDVNLKIYDIQGRVVFLVAEGYYNTGVHEFTFDASNIASGTYYAILNVGDETYSSKLLLVK